MSEQEKESINTEIEILKLIDHPNIVKLYDVFECEKFICLVIELMRGGELFDLIHEQKRLPE
jgi:serine/threonine protein kinase